MRLINNNDLICKIHVFKNQGCHEKMIGLVSLFNGISNFVGYLMAKSLSQKKSSGTI